MKKLRPFCLFAFFVCFALPNWAQVQNPDKLDKRWKTDTTIHTVPLEEFKALLPRDGIPPIDRPKFFTQKQALQNYFEHEPVIALEIEGVAKAYPLNVLTYHEIVNDKIGEVPVTATYCPLCNAAIIFDRRLTYKGKKYILDFGVSGMLRKSDMVMWDRQTQTWWQQIVGEAVVGKLAGATLTQLDAQIISLKEFFKTYPKGEVLSTDTGFEKMKKRYGKNYYKGYDSSVQPRLFKGKVDSRLPAMERVIDIYFQGKYKIYPLKIIQKWGVINDRFKRKNLVIFHQYGTRSILDKQDIQASKNIGTTTVFDAKVNGQVLTFKKAKQGFTDQQTGSVWDITGHCIAGKHQGKKLRRLRYGNHFAFAWFAFHPDDSELYQE
ncbi:MAG TPA: hypothetical protein DCS93_16140 [Microscillaceae bacterium]|nr:hypothetical protein [Microscillaceae bacterium]